MRGADANVVMFGGGLRAACDAASPLPGKSRRPGRRVGKCVDFRRRCFAPPDVVTLQRALINPRSTGTPPRPSLPRRAMAARLVCAARALTLGARAPRSALWTDGVRVRPAALPSVVAVGPRGAAPAPALARFPTLATPRHALATHRPVSFAAVACRASSSPDSRFHPPEDDDDDVDALDDDDDEDAFVDDDFDIADVPFLVGEGGADGPTEVGVDVLIVDENGGPPSTDDDAFSVDALAAALEEDARALVRWLVDPPPESVALRRDAFPVRVSYAELSVALCTDAHIRGLNREWRDKDAPTDVLSFPSESFADVVVLGDCVLSVDTAKRQAKEVGHGLLDECRVLLVHGLLHLAGLDHETGDEDAERMAACEDELLGLLTRGRLAGGSRGLVSSSLSGARSRDVGSEREASSVDARLLGGLGRTAKADCLVLDLDGTLLNSECVITPRTADAIRDATAAGVLVFVATGKARPAAIRAAATAGLDGPDGIVSRQSPGVFLQGLDVYGRGGEALYKAEMPSDVVSDLFAEVYGTRAEGVSRGTTATNLALTAFCGDECATLAAHPLLDQLARKYHEPVSTPWDDVEALLRAARVSFGDAAEESGVRKLLLVAESAAAVDATRPAWEKIVGDRAEVTQAVPNMLEVLPRGNDKARGVATLLAHLGVERSRVVAVGDGENDVGMLRAAGAGVAMGNAGKLARRAAKYVVERTNDEDGVAEAIRKYVL